jgi:hypothetical protein
MAKNKLKIPKRIAGIKIRKRHRKAIQGLVGIAESPEVRSTIAALFGALAGSKSKSASRDRPAVH